MEQDGDQLDPASIHQGSPALTGHSHDAHPLCNLKIDENEYAEIGPGPTSGTGEACREHSRTELKLNVNQSQPIKPPSIGAYNELAMSNQSLVETDDVSPIEMCTGSGGECNELAEETLCISEREANTKLIGMGCGGVQSAQLLQENAPDCDATPREVDVLAKSESFDLEAAASSSTTTYNAVGNFQVGISNNEMNTGEEYEYDGRGCSNLFYSLISFPHLPHLHLIAVSNFQVRRDDMNTGETLIINKGVRQNIHKLNLFPEMIL